MDRPASRFAIAFGTRKGLAISAAFFAIVAYALVDPTGLIDLARNIVIFATVLTLVVGIHEFCHLLMAIALGIKPKEYALAFGPAIASKQKWGITWRINVLPIGGYVKLTGESEDEGEGSFATAAAYKKILILVVGPISNLILAVLLLAGLARFMAPAHSIGQNFEFAFLVIGTIIDQTVAAVTAFLPHATSDPLAMPLMGVPGMVASSGTMLTFGPHMLVIFAAAISFSMGVMNLLPIPPLDGGQALVAGLQGLMGRYYPKRVMGAVSIAALAAIVVLMVTINGLDLLRVLTGQLPTGQ